MTQEDKLIEKIKQINFEIKKWLELKLPCGQPLISEKVRLVNRLEKLRKRENGIL